MAREVRIDAETLRDILIVDELERNHWVHVESDFDLCLIEGVGYEMG